MRVSAVADNAHMTERDDSLKRKPIVHKKPLPATVRQLYGTAFRCGKPDCGRPLYKLNDETGEVVLNSHVAHLCARSEGGPRWNQRCCRCQIDRHEPKIIAAVDLDSG